MPGGNSATNNACCSGVSIRFPWPRSRDASPLGRIQDQSDPLEVVYPSVARFLHLNPEQNGIHIRPHRKAMVIAA